MTVTQEISHGTVTGRCQACGTPLPPHQRKPGPPRKWCSERCRKSQYAGTCEVCGGPTDGTTPSKGVARVCQACHEWDEPSIIEAIRRWAREHDGVPPRSQDWCPAPPGYPATTVVIKRLGWNNALLAAGFDLRRDCRAETQAWVMSQLRAGVPTRDIAAALGVTPNAIHERLRYRGLTVTAVRGKALA